MSNAIEINDSSFEQEVLKSGKPEYLNVILQKAL